MTTKLDSATNISNSEIDVRLVTLADLPAILDITNWAIEHTTGNLKCAPDTMAYWHRQWEENHQCFPWFVAVHNGDVIGYAMAYAFANRCGFVSTAEVSTYVNPEHHGRGIGTLMYRSLIPALETQRYRTVIAMIAMPNIPSERLHKKFGFQKVGTLSNVGWKLGRWHDVSYWQRSIDAGNGQPQPINTLRDIDIIHNDPDRFTPDISTAKGDSH